MLYEIQVRGDARGAIRRESDGPTVAVQLTSSPEGGRRLDVMDQGPTSPKRTSIPCADGPIEIEICFVRASR